jgi:glucose/arabinose dehydrogenase
MRIAHRGPIGSGGYLQRHCFFACLIASAAMFAPTQFSPLLRGATPQLPGFSIDQPLSGLGTLTAITFAPDGTLFLAAKGGAIRALPYGAGATASFASVSVYTNSECGLLGIALDPAYPGFGKGGYVFVFATVSSSEQRIIRFRDEGGKGVDRTEIQRGLPTLGANHDGGCLKISPDSKLFFAIGDGGSGASKAQDITNLFGSLMRLNLDGSIPADNPDLSAIHLDWRHEIYAYGFRNPFRIAFRKTGTGPSDYQVFVNDVGSSGGQRREEINRIQPGGNYGWPNVEGIPSLPNPLYIDPVHAYDNDGNSIVGGVFYQGSLFPAEFQGNYFYMDYGSDKIFRIVMDGDAVASNTLFADAEGGLIDIAESPDGALYYTTAGGAVYRIRYETSGNQKPQAQLDVLPLAGSAPLGVAFDAGPSIDADGTIVRYDWSFGDSSSVLDGGAKATHVYTEDGVYTARVIVRDNQGGTASAQASITVSTPNDPPVPEILSPAEGATFDAGVTVQVSGRALDPEDGELTGDKLLWDVILVHNEHTHPFVTGAKGASGSFDVPLAGIEEGWSFRIVFTATDSKSKSVSVERTVGLNYLPLGFETVPAGLRVTADGVSLTGPATYQAVQGARIEVNAPSPQTLEGAPAGSPRYVFQSWSDGGSATHEVVMTPGTTLTATFAAETLAPFLRGDANHDGQRDISDAIFTLNFLFSGGAAPICPDGADANDDGILDLSDAIAVLGVLFFGTNPLPPPSAEPGPDPTPDGLECH